jgi:hypothetical protein
MSEKGASAVDRVQEDRAREILLVLGNAVSAAKLFPSDHQTVRNFISDLHLRLAEYLDTNWKLELGIEEQAFTLEGKTISHDPNAVRSLPFFFFKDGMKRLGFYRGLQKAELEGFLEAIRAVSQLPPEEGDIVNALWEKDFTNIRYFAPDDFLAAKIGVGRPRLQPEVDVDSLNQGRVELTPEDLEEVRNNTVPMSMSGQRAKTGAGERWTS